MNHNASNDAPSNETTSTVPNTSMPTIDDEVENGPETHVIGELVPFNQDAKEAVRRLALEADSEVHEHHLSFIQNDGEGFRFIFSLGNLPQHAPRGWRVGRGRENLPKMGVDILLLVLGRRAQSVGGLHARFAWVKGGGGFFLIADNSRGLQVSLNGEILKNCQRLIPFQNMIGIGEYFFTFKFMQRTPKQEEEFQRNLKGFYSLVLEDKIPNIAPTPSEHEQQVGQWIVRFAISKGSFGHVYAVSSNKTGEYAAAKELWKTRRNERKVEEEVKISRLLVGVKHKRLATPFDIRQEDFLTDTTKARMRTLLDDTWQPGYNDANRKYIIFSPLSTTTFETLIKSDASHETRTTLFAQVLDGLSFLHKSGITHRDIKPSNLTIHAYDPPSAQIIDFGSATLEDSILYDYPGTIMYLAPEQRVKEYAGRAVDIWACGLVGIQVLGWRFPSSDQITETVLRKIHVWIERTRQTEMLACCRRMLEYEPNDRITAEEALVHYFAAYCKTDVEIEDGNKRRLEKSPIVNGDVKRYRDEAGSMSIR